MVVEAGLLAIELIIAGSAKKVLFPKYLVCIVTSKRMCATQILIFNDTRGKSWLLKQ